MRQSREIIWRFFGARLSLAPLDHADIDRLYKARRLPLNPAHPRGHDGARGSSSSEPLARCIESFEAILVASLTKAQPWLSARGAGFIVSIYCWACGGPKDEERLYRETRLLGEWTLEGLESQHRERFAFVIHLAGRFEKALRMVREAEDAIGKPPS